MSNAAAGQVLVSRVMADLVAGSGITFTDQGETTLKGLPGSWRLLAALIERGFAGVLRAICA